MDGKTIDDSMKLKHEDLSEWLHIRVGADLLTEIDNRVKKLGFKNRANYIRELAIKDLISNNK